MRAVRRCASSAAAWLRPSASSCSRLAAASSASARCAAASLAASWERRSARVSRAASRSRRRRSTSASTWPSVAASSASCSDRPASSSSRAARARRTWPRRPANRLPRTRTSCVRSSWCALGAPRLPPHLLERALHLGGDVVDAQQVVSRLGELELGLVAARAELRDPGRLLEQRAAVGRPRRQHLADTPLLDHRVRPRSQAGVHQAVHHVLEADALAADAVVGGAVAVDAARNLEAAVVPRAGRPQRQRHLGGAQRRPIRRPGEDHVGHRLRAQQAGGLLAEHPGDRVGDVRLAGAVGADDGDDRARKGQLHPRGEGFEALKGKRGQAQNCHRRAADGITDGRAGIGSSDWRQAGGNNKKRPT